MKTTLRATITLVLLGLGLVRAGAQPAIRPDAGVMALDDLGLYAVGYAYRGQPERQFPLGWSGFFEDKTGVACEPCGTQNGRRAFLLHCPWRNGTGVAFQQFDFLLPAHVTRITLTGATAMKSDVVGKSDGVTFRIFANGTKLLERNQTNDTWEPFEFDFTSLAGSNLALRFETDPGLRNDASFDYSLWGDRTLTIEGFHPPVVTHPVPVPLVLSNVWSAETGDVVPRDGFGGSNSWTLSNHVARFDYSGADGSLEYVWTPPQSDNNPLLGKLTLRAKMTGDSPVSVALANAATISWTHTATLQSRTFRRTISGVALRQVFRIGITNAALCAVAQIKGKSLVLSVTCDQPFVRMFDSGGWGPTLRRRQLVVPYYTGAVFYLPRENLFVNAFLDWTASAASSQELTRANYEPLTDGSRNCLTERAIFAAAWHPAEVFPNIPNPPSPYLGMLANKIILDIWGGAFDRIAQNLANLADYGITNCVALIHDWQRSGYDNALPAHYPAQARLGGDVAMSNLVATATRLGMRIALHENYVDYYPNYDFFNTNDISLDSQGKRVVAWYNPGTHIQSFAEKPNAILRLAATQSPEIYRRYKTTADYLDVNSSVPPWFHVDFRAGETGAGTFARVWQVHRQLWAYERNIHHGPVFGEGNNHWYWSGFLDGAEAQFGSGWPANQGFNAPLKVGFDLLKIHPLQFNHGMGYHSRWWPSHYETNWAGPPPMFVLDQYRLQTVAYGHAGFLDSDSYSIIPYAWLECHLLTPVTARYGNARPVQIRFEQDGAWVDLTAAAKAESTEDRVRVIYENGLVITANASSNNISVAGWVLPQFGWLAQAPGLVAGTVLRDGVVADFADSKDSSFVNARSAVDWNLSDFHRIHPVVAQFQQSAPRTFRVIYAWDVGEALSKDYRCFVHFCQGNEIKFQQDHVLSLPTSQWTAGQTNRDGSFTVNIPADIPDGDYDWLIGLFDPGSGARVRLWGCDDGESRIRLGALRIHGNGTLLSFIPDTNTNYSDPSSAYLAHLNGTGKVIDFSDLRTDGSVWVHREAGEWMLQTWPRDRSFVLEISSKKFGSPEKVGCVGGSNAEVRPIVVGSRWRLPLNGARQYRWPAARMHTLQ